MYTQLTQCNARPGINKMLSIPCTYTHTEVTLGFTTTEVTVIEGETVRLTVQIINGTTSDRIDFFRVFTDRGKGNATGS